MMVGDGDVANAEFARPLEMVFDLGCGVIAPLAVQVQVVLCLRLLRAIHEIGPLWVVLAVYCFKHTRRTYRVKAVFLSIDMAPMYL